MGVLSIFVVFLLCCFEATQGRKERAMPAALDNHRDLGRVSSVESDKYLTEVIFVVKHRLSIADMEKELFKVSDPSSSAYGQHWSKEQVIEGSRNEVSSALTRQYLEDLIHIRLEAAAANDGFMEIDEEKTASREDGLYLYVKGSVGLLESILHCEFHLFENKQTQQKMVRTKEYTIPLELEAHIDTVLGTVHLDGQLDNKFKIETDLSGTVDPAFLGVYYGLETYFSYDNSVTSQGVYETASQDYSPSDLTIFQNSNGINTNPAIYFGESGHSSSTTCTNSAGSCAEANLDVQYITAVGRGAKTYFMYFTENSGT